MKRLSVLFALLAITTCASAGVVGNWGGTGGNVGNWTDPTMWQEGVAPVPAVAGDQINVGGGGANGAVITIDTAQTYAVKTHVNIYGSPAAGTPAIVNLSASFNTAGGDLSVGSEVAAGAGYVNLNQTGGTMSVASMFVGRMDAAAIAGTVANGRYSISGGSIVASGSLWINGVNSGSGPSVTTYDPDVFGRLTISGNGAAQVKCQDLWIASDTKYSQIKNANGALEFIIGSSGVTPVTVTRYITINGKNGTGLGAGVYYAGLGKANLALGVLDGAILSTSNIVLISNTSGNVANGVFNQLNGIDVVGGLTQGYGIVLGGNGYTLSYKYDVASGLDGSGNDVALVYTGQVPEPATLAILGLGGLLLRRRVV